jgi:HSP20 family molecular chaperone IbpA
MVNAAETTRTRPVYRPAADVYETADALAVVLEIPGADPDSIHVAVEKRLLTVTARTNLAVPAGYALAVSEFRPGDYERSFTLAETIDIDRIEAQLRDGILRLTLPKALPAPAKTISVQAG